jgi:hypothetical protein
VGFIDLCLKQLKITKLVCLCRHNLWKFGLLLMSVRVVLDMSDRVSSAVHMRACYYMVY